MWYSGCVCQELTQREINNKGGDLRKGKKKKKKSQMEYKESLPRDIKDNGHQIKVINPALRIHGQILKKR
jgi:hypothetical protein